MSPPKLQSIPASALKSPTEEERAFETYLHYLQSINGLCFVDGLGRSPHASIAAACHTSPNFRKIQRNSGADLDRVGQLLRNAWSTEVTLRLSRRLDEELVRYANHWAAVQAYYTVYLQAQAYFRASGKPDASDHAAAMKTLSADLRSGRLSAPPPWAVLCTSEKERGRDGFLGLPDDAQVDTLSTLSLAGPSRFWSYYGMTLRTTRERLVDLRVAEWKRQNKKDGAPRKRIAASKRAELDAALHATTLFDFLYRFRLRSNYRDVDTLLDGTTGEKAAKVFNESLLNIADTTALIFEAHTRRYAGSTFYDETAKAFLERSTTLAESPVRERLVILTGCV